MNKAFYMGSRVADGGFKAAADEISKKPGV